ncbi:methyl-accepting chemotaxis protein [Halalkalibacter okhensis]|uniref:Chemotaxis protein n=1 Tax=Halalkalibacter okhensis TaxID=333138 RepID=A0A0B0IFF6_9BACI|nr:methyl-accepting chemotaxis protein [Halalkalibacter okhensis]KHF39627.1 hypothetical protein LQ50_14445 [Halalkalibacter okhensis]
MKHEQRNGKKNLRLNLQAKLTLMIVFLIFVITSLSTTVTGTMQAYIENLLLLNIITAAVTIILGAVGAFFIIRLILKKPLEQLTELALAFNNNDFTKRITLKSGDEFQTLSEVFNGTADQMETLISEIQASSEILSNRTMDFKGSLKETQESSQQIAASTEEFTSGTEQLTSEVAKIADEATEMSAGLQQFAVSIEQVDDSASNVIDYVQKGEEAISSSIERAESTKNKVGETVENVTLLNTKSKAINDVIVIINGIAEQTNLLALNASIEAARAGEHGKGFAVVADEVRKLATQSKESTVQIQQLVQDIQGSITDIVEDAQTSEVEIINMVEEVKHTGETIKNINVATTVIKKQSHEIRQTIKELTGRGEQINDSITNTSAVMEESRASTEEVAASTEQQTETMNQLSGMSEELEDLSKGLDELVRKFQISTNRR